LILSAFETDEQTCIYELMNSYTSDSVNTPLARVWLVRVHHDPCAPWLVRVLVSMWMHRKSRLS